MLRKTLLIACLLGVSGSALAFDEYVGRHGVRVEPRLSITFGGGHYDYREPRYHGYYVPRPVHVRPIYYGNYYRGHAGHHYGRHHGWQHRDRHDGWRGHDRHDDGRRGHRGHDDD